MAFASCTVKITEEKEVKKYCQNSSIESTGFLIGGKKNEKEKFFYPDGTLKQERN